MAPNGSVAESPGRALRRVAATAVAVAAAAAIASASPSTTHRFLEAIDESAAAAAAAASPRGGGGPFLDALAVAHRPASATAPAAPAMAATAVAATVARPAAAAAEGLAGRIDEVLAAPLAELGGGVSYAVARDGVTVAAGSLGVASVELGAAMTAASRTDVASVSKQFTAFLLYWLDDRGDLSMDDDVRTHVPELPRFTGGAVTLRHLVHHVSGLLDCFTPVVFSRGSLDDSLLRPALLASIRRQSRLRFPPGSKWEYSNTNYVLAGLVAERVSGKPLARLLRDVIFAPLGMDASDLYDSPARVYPGLASSYARNITEAPVPGGRLGMARVRASRRMTAIGTSGIVTTPADLLRWAENFRNNTIGGGRRLVQAMETPYVLHAANGSTLPVDYASAGGYGGGLFILDAPLNDSTVRVVHHGGAISGYRSILLRVPDAGLAVVLQATSSAFSKTYNLAARIAAMAAPDVLGGGGGGSNAPKPTAEATPNPTETPVNTPAPTVPDAMSRMALSAAAGVWTLDGMTGAAASFEVRVYCAAESTRGKKGKVEEEGENDRDHGDDQREAAGCRLFIDLGWFSRSLLAPVTGTRFVGALAGSPASLSLDISAPANRSAPSTAVLSVVFPGKEATAPVTATATRHSSLQVGAAALSAVAGTYTSDDLGATYKFIPRGGGLGLALDDVEGRLGSTLIPCCVDDEGRWRGSYTSARPALISEVVLGGRGAWLTMTFRGDAARLDAEDGADGRGDLAGVPFRRVGTCHV